MRLAACLLLMSSTTHAAESSDHYADFFDLAKHEREGLTYRVEVVDRKTPFSVIAIHGGGIERGTELLARAIAASELSIYLFEGLKATGNQELHVTSNHFNDPRAVSLMQSSKLALSIHGFKEESQDQICVGGRNFSFRDRVTRALSQSKLNIQVISPCVKFDGEDVRNIVNRAQNEGVQLELSTHLRKRMAAEPKLLFQLATVLRDSFRRSIDSK